jgi:hypothetical protein
MNVHLRIDGCSMTTLRSPRHYMIVVAVWVAMDRHSCEPLIGSFMCAQKIARIIVQHRVYTPKRQQ